MDRSIGKMFSLFFFFLILGLVTPRKQFGQRNWNTLDGLPIKIIGHRGEKILMPEHTVGSYEFAAIEGADYVEPDLVLTKDGVLVCFHDLTLKQGTNVQDHEEFQHLMRNFSGIIGINNRTIVNDWFIKDFTLAELKTLKVTQKNIGIRPQYFNLLFSIPTFDEYLMVIHKMSKKMNKLIGIIPELKNPKFHNDVWNGTEHFMETTFLSTLRRFGYKTRAKDKSNCFGKDENNVLGKIPCGHVIVQSFDPECLKYLKKVTNIPLLFLIHDEVEHLTRGGFENISEFAHYLTIWKEFLYVGVEAEIKKNKYKYNEEIVKNRGGFLQPNDFVREAHILGMKIGIYTIYDSREPSLRGCSIQCDPENKEREVFYYFDMGVDFIFSENIIEARELRQKYDNELKNLGRVESSAGTCKGAFVKFSITLLFITGILQFI